MRRAVLSLCAGALAVLLCAGCGERGGQTDTVESETDKKSTEALNQQSSQTDTEKIEEPAEREEPSPYFSYEIDQAKKYATITSYLDEEEDTIVIPDYFEYEGEKYPVTHIADEAFYYNTSVRHVSIPETVTYIGKEAFCKCEALQSIELPGSAVTLGTGVFYDCSSLETVELGEGIVNIPDEFFTNCYALKDISLPETLTAVGAEAFWSCENLTELELPKSVVSAGERCFYDSGIKTLKILSPSFSVTEDTLEGADDIEEIYVPESLADMVSEYVNQEIVKISVLE